MRNMAAEPTRLVMCGEPNYTERVEQAEQFPARSARPIPPSHVAAWVHFASECTYAHTVSFRWFACYTRKRSVL